MQLRIPERSRTVTPSFTSVANHVATLERGLELLKTQVRQVQQIAGLGTAALMLVHETNNLLTPVLGYAQAALASNDVELMKKALSVTVTNNRMLIAMSERILELGAARKCNPQRAQVSAAINDARASLCRDLSKDGIQFLCEVDSDETVWMDPLHLRQVLFNLFLNARQALSDTHNGRITIRSRKDGMQVLIEVSDTGKGIPENLLPHVFEPLQTTKETSIGGRDRCSGLGLALCRDLVEEAGGKIHVRSSVGKGTTFCLVFPQDPLIRSSE